METQIIDLTAGGGTQIIGSTTETVAKNFTGGLLQIHEQIEGWEVTGKLGTLSGEADIYMAEKDGEKGIIKYYRSTAKPKTDILERIKQLNHPDIVNVYTFGTHNERFYEIMEYAAGGALDTRNEDGSYRYLPLPEEKVEGICAELINAFKTCHDPKFNIIHRDIKPANIYYRTVETEEIAEGEEKKIVYKGDDVVIADFGISSMMEDAEQLHKTRTGSRTTGYAAPEVLTGNISPKMDYYALGITLWELLTGKDPFTLENGKRRNDAHLIRDTIEGRIVDDILSKEPRVSQKMERLIRGLLVIDHAHRWGFDEVTRHLAGENVEIVEKAKKPLSFKIDNTECTSLETLGTAIMENPEAAQKYIFKGLLVAKLEDDYPDIAKQIIQIADESSAAKDDDNGVIKIAYLLNPGQALKIANGFKIENLDDLVFLLENAPESIIPLLRDEKSRLFTWMDIMGYADIAAKIKNLPGVLTSANAGKDSMGDAELAGKAEVLLRRKVIKPFKLAMYADFELSTLEQIRKVPKDMQRRIKMLVNERSYEGLFLPWLELLVTETDNFKDKGIEKNKEYFNTLLAEYFGLPKGTSAGTGSTSAGSRFMNQSGAIISHHKPCAIDEAQSKIKKDALVSYGKNQSYNIELSIKIAGTLPDNVTEFWYFVRTKSPESTEDPWVSQEEIEVTQDIIKAAASAYQKNGEIVYTTTAKDEIAYYVTMFTVYEINGKKSISSPAKKRFDRALNANLFWKVTKPLIGNRQLSIEIEPNRHMTRVPKLILSASLQGNHLGSYKDESAVTLMEIPEQELDSPKPGFKKEYEVVLAQSLKLTKNTKLFLFVSNSAANECYSVRRAAGYEGKA